MALTAAQVEASIRIAFVDAPYPGDDRLVRSSGDEPDEVVELFRGKRDWTSLSAEFVDKAGAASPSALSFFSDAAFRLYLPAFLVADLHGALVYTDPVFYLFHGFDEATRAQEVRVHGEPTRTWFEMQQSHFSLFSARESAAIVEYLRWRLEHAGATEPERRSIAESLNNYWLRTAERQGKRTAEGTE